MSRDPIGEQGGMNLYATNNNDSLNNIDFLGNFTLGDARRSLFKRGVNPEGPTIWYTPVPGAMPIRVKLYSDFQVFIEWHLMEVTSGGTWWTVLPKCPKELCIADDKPVNPDIKKWKNPGKTPDLEEGLHPGAYWTLRSKKFSGHSNQCVYTQMGKLLTVKPAAGTVDFRAPISTAHWFHDVDPVVIAGKLDGNPIDITEAGALYTGSLNFSGVYLEMYYQVRPAWHE